ncbi:XRE family transcriptional regulator [Methyloceanibacter methanicus]|uniref:XRE family transcriptional regulator n=1 Tax=Methyloceanibacter methanicus TaxID=1774968 RepID=UPI001FCE0AA0|nr:XRE family transcriptional regulator [Methyloceanibacter methanicus]
MTILAERAGIHRETLGKIEKGDPGVLMAHYASVLFVLGFEKQLADIADITHDQLGRDLEEEALPKRIHTKRRKPSPERE